MIKGYIQTASGKIYPTEIDVNLIASYISLFENVICTWRIKH